MGEYDAPKRPLPFPLKDQLVLNNTTAEDDCEPSSAFVWPDDPDERVTILFSLSLNEYNVLGSTIDVGSDIAYGEDAIRVTWLWLRNMRCTVPICEEIIACIEDDADTQDAILDMLNDSERFTEQIVEILNEHPSGDEFPKDLPIPPNVHLTPTQPDACDYDVLFGDCWAIVRTADSMIRKFFTAWSNYADETNIITDVVSDVPLLRNLANSIGLGGVSGYAALIASGILTAYDTAATTGYLESLACALWCRAYTDCFIDIQATRGVLNIRVGNILSEFDNTAGIMQTLVSIDLTGLNVADVYMSAFFNLLGAGNLLWPDVWGIDAFLTAVAVTSESDNGWDECEACANPSLHMVMAGGWEHWTPTYQGLDRYGYEMWDFEDMAGTGFRTFATYSDSDITNWYIHAYEVIAGSFVNNINSYTQNGGIWESDHFDTTLLTYGCSAEGDAPYIGNIMRLHLQPVP